MKKILSLLLVLFLIVGCGSSGAKEEEPTYGIGDTVMTNDVEVKVKKTKTLKQVGTYIVTKPKGIFYSVEVDVTNKKKEAFLVATTMFKIVADGATYEADAGASVVVTTADNSKLFSNLNPNISETGTVIFDLPKELVNSDLQLEVYGDSFGMGQDKKVINLY